MNLTWILAPKMQVNTANYKNDSCQNTPLSSEEVTDAFDVLELILLSGVSFKATPVLREIELCCMITANITSILIDLLVLICTYAYKCFKTCLKRHQILFSYIKI